MRELNRFRDEFNSLYSMRSWLLKVSKITEKINDLIIEKDKIIKEDEKKIENLEVKVRKLDEIKREMEM